MKQKLREKRRDVDFGSLRKATETLSDQTLISAIYLCRRSAMAMEPLHLKILVETYGTEIDSGKRCRKTSVFADMSRRANISEELVYISKPRDNSYKQEPFPPAGIPNLCHEALIDELKLLQDVSLKD